jgi:hypothetical protein
MNQRYRTSATDEKYFLEVLRDVREPGDPQVTLKDVRQVMREVGLLVRPRRGPRMLAGLQAGEGIQ